MNSRDLIFTTSRFNVSEVRKHYANPACFGDDLIAWLRGQLQSHGVPTRVPVQDSWGWYTEATLGKQEYFLGVSGKAEEGASVPNRGEWRVILQKRRTFRDRLRRSNGLDNQDKLLTLLMHLLGTQPDFENRKIE